jgi:hypothetical protein
LAALKRRVLASLAHDLAPVRRLATPPNAYRSSVENSVGALWKSWLHLNTTRELALIIDLIVTS